MTVAEHRLRLLRRLPSGIAAAEIGVFRGDFARAWLDTSPPARLWLVDPWRSVEDEGRARAWYHRASGVDMDALYEEVQARFADEIAAGSVTLLRGASPGALAPIPDASLDVAYIDGDHRHEAVLADLEICHAKIRVGGMILLDDHRLGRWWGDGVVRAVNDFLGRHAGDYQIAAVMGDQVGLRRRSDTGGRGDGG